MRAGWRPAETTAAMTDDCCCSRGKPQFSDTKSANRPANIKGGKTMANFNPREYFPTLQEWIRYGGDITWDDYSIMKNHGDRVQLMFPSSAAKGHDTYDLYHDGNGRMTKVFGHPGNADLRDGSTIDFQRQGMSKRCSCPASKRSRMFQRKRGVYIRCGGCLLRQCGVTRCRFLRRRRAARGKWPCNRRGSCCFSGTET